MMGLPGCTRPAIERLESIGPATSLSPLETCSCLRLGVLRALPPRPLVAVPEVVPDSLSDERLPSTEAPTARNARLGCGLDPRKACLTEPDTLMLSACLGYWPRCLPEGLVDRRSTWLSSNGSSDSWSCSDAVLAASMPCSGFAADDASD